jgi:hypothetical protein
VNTPGKVWERLSAGNTSVHDPRLRGRTLLLQRDPEQSHPASTASHHVQKIANVGAFLNIVGEVEMRIVEFIIAGLCTRRRNAYKQNHGDRPEKQPPLCALQGTLLTSAISLRLVGVRGTVMRWWKSPPSRTGRQSPRVHIMRSRANGATILSRW